MMSFLVLPPEVNSARMFGGAGSGPLLAVAAAWDGLAAELGSAAASFSSVTSQLVGGPWQGPSSVAMAVAGVPYAGWLSAAAAQAGQAGGQVRAAAAVFEAALAATVHPGLVAANRAQLVSLATSNVLGQNAPAIAAAEAEYEQMWAQDVAAMVGYHGGASAVASALPPFTGPLANLASLPGQVAGAIAAAVSTPVTLGLPQITIPPIHIPGFQLPEVVVPNITVGSFTAPAVGIPMITLGSFSLPATTLSLTVPSITIPSFNFPGFAIAGITVGGINTPQIATTPLILPEIKLPPTAVWIPPNGSGVLNYRDYGIGFINFNNPSTTGNYIDIELTGIPSIALLQQSLNDPSTMHFNVIVEIEGPIDIPAIYLGDYDLATQSFTHDTGFVLPPITVGGTTLPGVGVGAWSTPAITIEGLDLTVGVSGIDVSGVTVGPVAVPPITIGGFSLPETTVGGIDVGAFSTHGPITIAGGPITIDVLATVGAAVTNNPLSGFINASGGGITLGPIATPAVTATIDLPPITVPQIPVPAFNLPAITIPPINLAAFTTGDITVPPIVVGGIDVAQVSLPSIDIAVGLPELSTSTFTTPAILVEGFGLPQILIPQITTPEITFINPSNVADTFGLFINYYAYLEFGNAFISFSPNPWNGGVLLAVPALQFPPLTLVNSTDVGLPYSMAIGGTIGELSVPPITIPGIDMLAINPQGLAISGLTVSNIELGNFSLPEISVLPISVGAPAGFSLPQIGIGGIQVGGFSTPGPITIPIIPPIGVTVTIPPITVVPAIPLSGIGSSLSSIASGLPGIPGLSGIGPSVFSTVGAGFSANLRGAVSGVTGALSGVENSLVSGAEELGDEIAALFAQAGGR